MLFLSSWVKEKNKYIYIYHEPNICNIRHAYKEYEAK